MFIVDAKVNPRNDHWFGHIPKNVPVLAKSKLPVIKVVSSKGDFIPSHFFQKGKVTKMFYFEVFRNQ